MEAQLAPRLSVVVAIVSDTLHPATVDRLRPCLQSLLQQVDPPTMEIIVPHCADMSGIDQLKPQFPQVRFLAIGDLKLYTGRTGSREHHNELRAHGVAAAKGDIVALIEDLGLADPAWCASIVEAHLAPVAAVGGAVENAVDRIVNWAIYFIDFGQYQNPLTEDDTLMAADANVSYKRSALVAIRPVWREVFSENAVNWALRLRGERVVLSSRMITYQNRAKTGIAAAMRERYVWGWSYGAQRGRTGLSRIAWALLSPALPVLILGRLLVRAVTQHCLTATFLKAFPLMALLAAAWCFGEMVAYLRPARISPAGGQTATDDYFLSESPRLSVVVIPVRERLAHSQGSELEASLDGLKRQMNGPPLEIIVPCAAASPELPELQARFPQVLFLPSALSSPPRSAERIEELRAIGVAAASGNVIAVTEDHVVPDPDWSAEILKAHQQGYAAIGGAIENGVDRILNWAVYFSDLGRYHNPLPQGPSAFASVVNVSYKKAALDSILSVWQHRFNETAVHAALMAQAARLALSPRIVVQQQRQEVRLGSSMRDFFSWGRSFGSTRAKLAGPMMRVVYLCLAPAVPVLLLVRSGIDTLRKRRLVGSWFKSFLTSGVLMLAWSCGEFIGCLTGRAISASTQASETVTSNSHAVS